MNRLLRAFAIVTGLVLFNAPAGESDQRLPGVPTFEQFVATIRVNTNNVQALGYFYLLPESDVPRLELWVKERSQFQEDMDIAMALTIRKSAAALDRISEMFVHDDHRLKSINLSRYTREELTPLADAVRKKVDTIDNYSRAPAWLDLAAACGHSELLKITLDWVIKKRGRDSNYMYRLSPDLCAETIKPGIVAGPAENRMRVLLMLRNGWQKAPPKEFTQLLSDPEQQVRIAFVNTLTGSHAPEVLGLLKHAMADNDPAVHSAAVSVLLSCQCEGAAAAIREIAMSEKENNFARANAWTRLARLPGREDLLNAKRLWEQPNLDRGLQTSIGYYLREKGELDAILSGLSRLDPVRQSEVLADLASSNVPEVLQRLPAFLGKADAKLVVPVLNSLGNLKSPEAVALLIEQVKDSRVEVRVAAENGLSAATGHRIEGDPRSPQRITPAAVYQRWKTWYDRFCATPKAELQDQVAKIRTLCNSSTDQAVVELSRIGFDPIPALTRLAGTEQHSPAYLRVLAALPDSRATEALMELADSLCFQSRDLSLIGEAIMTRAADAKIIDQLIGHLNDADSARTQMFLTVLVRWRVEKAAAAIANKALVENIGYQQLSRDLAVWHPDALMGKARSLTLDANTAPDVRSRAVELLSVVGQERDIVAINQALYGKAMNVRLPAAQGLVQMALRQSELAQKQVVLAMANQDAEIAQLMQSEFFSALRSRSGEGRFELPPAICAYFRNAIKLPKADHPRFAEYFAVLVEAGDSPPVEIFNRFASVNAANQSAALNALIQTRNANALSYVQHLLQHFALPENQVMSACGWLQSTAKLPPLEVQAFKDDFQARKVALRDAQRGQPANGVTIRVDFGTTFASVGATGLKGKCSLSNAGSETIDVPSQIIGNVEYRPDSAYLGNQPELNFKPGQFQTLKVAPGQSLFGTLTYDAPRSLFGPPPQFVSLTFNWRSPTDGKSYSFTTKWIDLICVPELWVKIDQRSNSAK